MEQPRKVLESIVALEGGPEALDGRKYLRLAAEILQVDLAQLSASELRDVVTLAKSLYLDDLNRRYARHEDYFGDSKQLPYARFAQGVTQLRQGRPLKQIEAETGMSHTSLVAFGKWWRKNKEYHDPDDLRALYRAYLQRNLQPQPA